MSEKEKEIDCEAYIESMLESEKDSLLDYLFGYCDNPMELMPEDMRNLFTRYQVDDVQDIRFILENNYLDSMFCGMPPRPLWNTIWFNVAEIEVSSNEIPENCIDDFTIIGDYAYYYIGYGMQAAFNVNGIEVELQEYALDHCKTLYTCIDYFDVWGNKLDGFEVNNLARVKENIPILPTMSDREIFSIFADIVGINKKLRSIEVTWYDDSFIEIIYTAQSVNGYYPLGRFELQQQ